MTYDIRVKFEAKDQRKIDYTDRATEIMFTTKDGLDVIKYMRVEKKRFTWLSLPNEYQMEKYYESFQVTIKRVETGEEIYNYSNV